MQSPFVFSNDKPLTHLCHVFGTPLAVQGWNWLPANQAIFWGLFTWQSTKKHPSWRAWQHLSLGALKMVVVLGSEWCHNFAHVWAARRVGRPVDQMRIFAGMPVLIYHEPEHPSITPRQHILRSAAGPACNWLLLLISRLAQRITRPDSPAREVAAAAVAMNAFIAPASLLPVSVFDGGPILKWSLISRGISRPQADRIITRTNLILGAGLAGAAVVSIRKRRWLLTLIFSFLSALALASGFGKMKG
jgi:Zn-dependent protease